MNQIKRAQAVLACLRIDLGLCRLLSLVLRELFSVKNIGRFPTMRDLIEYLVIVVLAVIIGVSVLKGVILEPAMRLVDRTANAIGQTR